MTATQYAWFYLVQNGSISSDPRVKSFDFGAYERFMDEIRTIGVDWFRTKAPITTVHEENLEPSLTTSEVSQIEGTLVLKNGVTQKWVVDALDFDTVYEMMSNTVEVEQQMLKLFGNIS